MASYCSRVVSCALTRPGKTGAGKPADYDATLPAAAHGGAAFFRGAAGENFRRPGPATGRDAPGHAAGMTDRRDWATPAASGQYSGRTWTNVRLGVTMASMSASDAAPLPRLGEVFFDVRGSSRSMRLSWYADTGIAVFSIWQGGTCTGTFRLPMDDLPRLMDSLRRGLPGGPEAAGQEAGSQDVRGLVALGGQRPRLAIGAAPAEPFTGAMTALPDDHAAGYGEQAPGYGGPANGAAGYGADAGYGT